MTEENDSIEEYELGDDYLAELSLPELTKEQEQALRDYAQLVHETNQHTNLTGAKDIETIWTRHVLDSLYISPFLSGDEHLIDIGSGGGFPAIPTAILFPNVSVTMVESTGKKARFLNNSCEQLQLNKALALPERAEVLGHDPRYRATYDIVTARAVTSLAALIELSVPFLKVGGSLLAMKGRRADEEIIAAEHALDCLKAEITGFHSYLDETGEEAYIIVITKMTETQRDYPRATGIPSKTPLGSD